MHFSAHDKEQFYPTTEKLSLLAWSLFKNKTFTKVLEPSAGEGDLAKQAPFYASNRLNIIDCIELNIERHSKLRGRLLNVIGVDFMEMKNADIYSHIIMNPPFAYGVDHVLHAWNILFEGEIVAIINAESIKNPHTKERKALLSLIEQFGSVQFVEDAFNDDSSMRKTDVTVALIYLNKVSDYENKFMEEILSERVIDQNNGDDLAFEYKQDNEITLSNSFIENMVLTYNLALQSAKKSAFAQAKAAYYSAMIGETMSNLNSGNRASYEAKNFDYVRKQLKEEYAVLKDKAWANILRSSNVTQHLSSKAQSKVESEFENIKKLEFTVSNIYGFLTGLIEHKGQIQEEMALEVFDKIVQHHSENTVFHLGWKSNNKHRTGGFRIKTTRFIIPGHSTDYKKSADYRTLRFLSDFDKVFAMLDGKIKAEISLEDAFNANYSDLYEGKRVDSSYFQMRFYPGIGTIHFFPKSKDLIDRLNRFVGRLRGWIPPQDSMANEAFWQQYDEAEKFDKSLRAKMKIGRSSWSDPFREAVYASSDENEQSLEEIGNQLMPILEENGIRVDGILEGRPMEFDMIEQKAA